MLSAMLPAFVHVNRGIRALQINLGTEVRGRERIVGSDPVAWTRFVAALPRVCNPPPS